MSQLKGDLRCYRNATKTVAKAYIGALQNLRKSFISVVMSVRVSVRMERRYSHWTDFREF